MVEDGALRIVVVEDHPEWARRLAEMYASVADPDLFHPEVLVAANLDEAARCLKRFRHRVGVLSLDLHIAPPAGARRLSGYNLKSFVEEVALSSSVQRQLALVVITGRSLKADLRHDCADDELYGWILNIEDYLEVTRPGAFVVKEKKLLAPGAALDSEENIAANVEHFRNSFTGDRLRRLVRNARSKGLGVGHQLNLARQVQSRLVPDRSPQVQGYDVGLGWRPCELIGGDYFDFLPGKSGRVGLFLTDIKGKGTSAALLGAYLLSLVRQVAPESDSPATVLRRVDRVFTTVTPTGWFATAFYGILDPAAHTLRYCNAGQAPAYHLRKGRKPRALAPTAKTLGFDGPALGLKPSEVRYRSAVVALQPGDVVLVGSDGITEAPDPAERELGESGLLDCLKGTVDTASMRDLVDAVFATVDRHQTGGYQGDDMTMLALRREC